MVNYAKNMAQVRPHDVGQWLSTGCHRRPCLDRRQSNRRDPRHGGLDGGPHHCFDDCSEVHLGTPTDVGDGAGGGGAKTRSASAATRRAAQTTSTTSATMATAGGALESPQGALSIGSR